VGQSILKLIPPDRHGEEDFILEKVGKGERIKQYDTVRTAQGRDAGRRFADGVPDFRRWADCWSVQDRARHHGAKTGTARPDPAAQGAQSPHQEPAGGRRFNRAADVAVISPEEMVDRISRRLHALSVSQDLMIDSEWRGADITNIIQWQLASII
jgi:hypothetical protein